jgi:hypothetical protein
MTHDAIPCSTVDDAIGRGSLAVIVVPLLSDWISRYIRSAAHRSATAKVLEIETIADERNFYVFKKKRASYEIKAACVISGKLPSDCLPQQRKGPAGIAGPRKTVVQRLILRVVLLHVIARHLQRNDVDFILVG